jgi:hypothetical protein
MSMVSEEAGMDARRDLDDRLEEALVEHASQERAYDELLARHGLTRQDVARAGEGRYLSPERRALLDAARDAADDPRPPDQDPPVVPPHAVPV